jgi:CPA1 family monovalent cation:H+ antiporter
MGFVVLLAIAMAVAIAARRLRLPYTMGLTLVGVGIALAKVDIGAALTHDFIFYVILPPLLFEAALALGWRDLRADAGVLLALSTLGTVIAAAFVAVGAAFLMHWPAPVAFVFGALIAATDPVAVIAMFKDNGVGGRLRTLLEAESLFNDAAAAILFSVAVGFNAASSVNAGAIGMGLVWSICGGALIGAACAGAAILLASRSREHMVEVALTVLAAYGAFLAAEQAHASGILATVAAGLVVGNVGVFSERANISEKAKEFALEFWDFAAFLANSAVFPLMGLAIGATVFAPRSAILFAGVIVLVLAARALSVYSISLLFARTRQAVPTPFQHVLWWGGLRGALALAFALSLPQTLAHRGEVIVTTFAVVAFSIIAQGLTMPLLLRRLGLVRAEPIA